MAHTSRGNLMGRAARTDRADQTNWLLDEQAKGEAREQLRKQAEIDRLMQACYDIEGDPFIDWWENDDNVPQIITRSEQIKILEARLRLDIRVKLAGPDEDGEPCIQCLRIHPPRQQCDPA